MSWCNILFNESFVWRKSSRIPSWKKSIQGISSDSIQSTSKRRLSLTCQRCATFSVRFDLLFSISMENSRHHLHICRCTWHLYSYWKVPLELYCQSKCLALWVAVEYRCVTWQKFTIVKKLRFLGPGRDAFSKCL